MTPEFLRNQAIKHWSGGDYLRACLDGAPWKPLEIDLRMPSGRNLQQDHPSLPAALAELQETANRCPGLALEWETIHHPQLGELRLPRLARFETEAAWLELSGKAAQTLRFKSLSAEIVAAQPLLRPLLQRAPELVLGHALAWRRLLAVLAWFQANKGHDMYLRQIDLPNIGSHFIETNQPILTTLLDAILPPEALDSTVHGTARHGFERRYGLRFEEPLIRFRLLDPSAKGALQGMDDFSVPASQFAALSMPFLGQPVEQVFISSNRINGLAFPAHPRAMVIFGLTHGMEPLQHAGWLKRLPIRYWGNLDTQGLNTLARLRRQFPSLQSLLMDTGTLDAHRKLCEPDPAPSLRMPKPLTPEEEQTFNALRQDGGGFVRLRQELVGYSCLLAALRNLS